MQEGPWERARALGRAVGAPPAVDADEFAALARGWVELTSIGEITGWAIVVRIDADPSSLDLGVLDPIRHRLEDLDAIGRLGPSSVGLLLDTDETGCRNAVTELGRILDGATIDGWRAVACRTSDDGAIDDALRRLELTASDDRTVHGPWTGG